MHPSSLHALVPVAALLFAAAASAQPVCTGSSHLLSWPDTDPIWELCWVRPSQSSGHFGSGLEIHDVSYQGQRVLKRAHSPILNVEYDPGGCACFRDWTDEEATFIADNEIVPGYAEPTSPPLTTCDVGGSGGDVGTFTGVAVEKNLDEVILTSHMSAGWYRYTQKWTLHRDGRIQPFVGFTSVPASCTANFNHRHHQYWRLSGFRHRWKRRRHRRGDQRRRVAPDPPVGGRAHLGGWRHGVAGLRFGVGARLPNRARRRGSPGSLCRSR